MERVVYVYYVYRASHSWTLSIYVLYTFLSCDFKGGIRNLIIIVTFIAYLFDNEKLFTRQYGVKGDFYDTILRYILRRLS